MFFIPSTMSQSINLPAIVYYPVARFFRPQMMIPHFLAKDIGCINPAALKDAGFQGVVFDKDNTLTNPYSLELHPDVAKAFIDYKRVFGENLAIMSNDAGTNDDRGQKKAVSIESLMDINVIRHKLKKPFGIRGVTDYFGCEPKRLVVFGDRLFTDIVFGNRYGMLTILVDPFTEVGDNPRAVSIRRGERLLLDKLLEGGVTPPYHKSYLTTRSLLDKK